METTANQQFPNTDWSMVLSARDGSEVSSRRALSDLCEVYWYPLYAFVRRSGKGPEDAADLTQGLFESLISHQSISGFEEDRGRFRSFLIGAMKNFMADRYTKKVSEKRGGKALHFSIEVNDAEQWYGEELRDDLSADRLYDRHWALTVLQAVFEKLRRDYERRGKEAQFESIKDCLAWNAGERPYAEIAEELGPTVPSIEQAVHRLRKRYRRLLEEEVSHTVASKGELRSEIGELLAALRS